MATGTIGPVGVLRLTRRVEVPTDKLTFKQLLYWTAPHNDLPREVFTWRLRNWPRMLNQLWRLGAMIGAGRLSGYPFMYGKLWLRHIDGRSNHETLYGVASLQAFTTAGRDEVVDEFDGATAAGFDLTSFNYHGIGTGVAAAADSDTALGTELTTEYSPDSTRATGAQSQPTSDVYRTLGTNTLDSGTPAITEQGVLSQAATGGGTLLDRHTFTAINLNGGNGDGLQSTYDLTIASGG